MSSTRLLVLPEGQTTRHTVSVSVTEIKRADWSSTSTSQKFLRLPHPRHGLPSLFLPHPEGQSILEVQHITPPAHERRSAFVDDQVVSGALTLCTFVNETGRLTLTMDPRRFTLFTDTCGSCFPRDCPAANLGQALAARSRPIRRGQQHLALSRSKAIRRWLTQRSGFRRHRQAWRAALCARHLKSDMRSYRYAPAQNVLVLAFNKSNVFYVCVPQRCPKRSKHIIWTWTRLLPSCAPRSTASQRPQIHFLRSRGHWQKKVC